MKQYFITLLNMPLLVAVLSVVIAGSIGMHIVSDTTVSASEMTVKAKAESIALGNQATGGSSGNILTLAFTTSGQVKSIDVAIGDAVHMGDVLATLDPQDTIGRLTQAKAAYNAATANYTKVVNGASSPAINVARASLQSATIARDEAKRQQDVLVDNSYKALLNVSPAVYPEDPEDMTRPAPTVSGSYLIGKEGDIVIELYRSKADSGYTMRLSGLVEGTGDVSMTTPQPIANSGLYIQFPQDTRADTWVLSVPNKKSADYVAKQNAYQAALQTREQVTASADAAVTQAQANLDATVASARPEDVAAAAAQVESARGALEIAQAAFDARKIIAPADGKVTAIRVTAGQITSVNVPAIEIQTNESHVTVGVALPNDAIFDRDGQTYVLLKKEGGLQETRVKIGMHDGRYTEIVSGILAGDEVVIKKQG